MEYKTSKFNLNERQLDLRIGLVNLINSHVEERGVTQEELTQVLQGLDIVLDESRFNDLSKITFREDQELEGWVLIDKAVLKDATIILRKN
jgi:hypothetical protein